MAANFAIAYPYNISKVVLMSPVGLAERPDDFDPNMMVNCP